ncbi:hypothetical protein L228DRAFT_244314 [Xylona heveae TC161]|uniref:Xylanolytic transcriptional activator regulatory domain-containing protein n=1 Tax=Xylona heveae (strain CBS 132557 / TC161) TaxID=1328760 RepID=A0A165IWA9_XYLHT|nr:hypothetical protein L228DRAFT_244314 [Xylona heveae TC161]KZF25469.1 hypothetical protein L228DRAFT_244314 [Xylona heveae TC161]
MSSSDRADSVQNTPPASASPSVTSFLDNRTTGFHASDGTPSTHLTQNQVAQQAVTANTYAELMKPKFARAPIKEAGRVAYLGESSNLTLLVHDRHGTTDVVHYPLPENVRGSKSRATELDQLEIDILHQRGAFLLPPRALCDDLVESFFRWIAPVAPVINRSRFMKRYRDPKNPPSLLLLQAVLLAGSRVCTNPQLMDANGSTTPAAMTFYKRAKALYDANYEDDRVTIIQALVLMGWYWEGPEGETQSSSGPTKIPTLTANIGSDVTKNVFYWTRAAIIIAQGSGMHRSVEGSQLSKADKRLWRRIWWTLFTRDRSVAVALGRPVGINTDDTDVEMISEDDFVEDDSDGPAEYPPNKLHVQFFLQYVKLCEIMGLVLAQQYSVGSKLRRQHAMDLTHSDMALADWLQNCPKEILWERSRHQFWSALLHSTYYTTLCLLHRVHIAPAPQGAQAMPPESVYPSRNIAFQAACMITAIVEDLQAHDELRFTPAFLVYSLFSALIMHVYQMRSPIPTVKAATREKITTCLNALGEVSKVWLVAKMVKTLFESILGNKVLEERLQKAAGKRHSRSSKQEPSPLWRRENQPKRKFDDMELGFGNGPPAPQVSYERSRPQSPTMVSSREPSQQQQAQPQPQHQNPLSMAAPPQTASHIRQGGDTFMGGGTSATNTRPPTPFNPSYSIPPTPPDLYLVTRNSPPISQSLWENFQPDQLFPAESNISLSQFSPQVNPIIDPQLSQTQPGSIQTPVMQPHHQQTPQPGAVPIPMQGQAGSSLQGLHGFNAGAASTMSSQAWPPGYDGVMGENPGASPDDSWSTGSSAAGVGVPATLNVEDWFHFLGINGDLNGMGATL